MKTIKLSLVENQVYCILNTFTSSQNLIQLTLMQFTFIFNCYQSLKLQIKLNRASRVLVWKPFLIILHKCVSHFSFLYFYFLKHLFLVGWDFSAWISAEEGKHFNLPPLEGAISPGFPSHGWLKGTALSYLFFSSLRLFWTKSTSYVIAFFHKLVHLVPLQLQMSPAKWCQVQMLASPRIWLITSHVLRKLRCILPLPRKMMSIK